MYINITGAVLVIISSILLAFALCQKERNALRTLKNAANAYSEISSDIRTGYTSLPDAFLNMYEKSYDKTIKEYFIVLFDKEINDILVNKYYEKTKINTSTDAKVNYFKEYLNEAKNSLTYLRAGYSNFYLSNGISLNTETCFEEAGYNKIYKLYKDKFKRKVNWE